MTPVATAAAAVDDVFDSVRDMSLWRRPGAMAAAAAETVPSPTSLSRNQ